MQHRTKAGQDCSVAHQREKLDDILHHHPHHHHHHHFNHNGKQGKMEVEEVMEIEAEEAETEMLIVNAMDAEVSTMSMT